MSTVVNGIPVYLDPDPKVIYVGYVHDVLIAKRRVASLNACYNIPAIDPAMTTPCSDRYPCRQIKCLWCAFRCCSKSFFNGLWRPRKKLAGCGMVERSRPQNSLVTSTVTTLIIGILFAIKPRKTPAFGAR